MTGAGPSAGAVPRRTPSAAPSGGCGPPAPETAPAGPVAAVDEVRGEVTARVRGAVVVALSTTSGGQDVDDGLVGWAAQEASWHGTPVVVVRGAGTRAEADRRRPALEAVRRAVDAAARRLPAARVAGLVLPGRLQDWLPALVGPAHCLVLDGAAGLTARAVSAGACPVVVVPPPQPGRAAGDGHDVVVGFDGSWGSWGAAWWGAGEAALRHDRLVLVRAHRSASRWDVPAWSRWDVPARRGWPAELEAQVHRDDVRAAVDVLRRAHAGLTVEGEVVEADPPARVLTAAGAGLLVVGAGGVWARPGEVGWTATAVARSANVPVVVVPAVGVVPGPVPASSAGLDVPAGPAVVGVAGTLVPSRDEPPPGGRAGP